MLPDLAASPCLLYCSLVYSIPRQPMVLRLTQEAGSTSREVLGYSAFTLSFFTRKLTIQPFRCRR